MLLVVVTRGNMSFEELRRRLGFHMRRGLGYSIYNVRVRLAGACLTRLIRNLITQYLAALILSVMASD